MKLLSRIVAGLVLAGLLLPAVAQWRRDEAGSQLVCVRETGERFDPGYASKSYTSAICNSLNKLETYIASLSEAQQLTLLRGVLPTGGAVPTNPPQALSSPWLQTDIGTPPHAGDAFDLANVLTITGSGDINNDVDSGHQIYQESASDYELCSVINSITGDSIYRAVGVSVRDDDIEEDSRYAWMRIDGLGYPRFQFKTNPSDFFDDYVTGSAPVTLPYAFRIVQNAGVTSGYVGATCATATTLIGSTAIAFSGTKFYGVTISSGGPLEASATGVLTLPTLTAIGSSAGTLQFTVATQSQAENSTPLTIAVSRAGGTSGSASVQVANAGTGSAVSGTDFTNVFPATLNWTNGDGGTRGQNVTIINRTGTQGSRTINLTLTGVSGASLGAQTTQTVTITDASASTGIKFRPGVSFWYNPGQSGSGGWYGWDLTNANAMALLLDYIADSVCPENSIKSLRVNASWLSLEGNTPGDYSAGFTRLDTIIAALRACSSGPKSMLLDVNFTQSGGVGSYTEVFPAYLVATAGGGTDSVGTYGIVDADNPGIPIVYAGFSRVWTTATADRAIALYTAYCGRYDTNPGLEMMNLGSETATNLLPGTGGFSYDNLETQTVRMAAAYRAACPHTAGRIHINYIDSDARALRYMALAQQYALDVGGPDTIVEEDIQANRAYAGELGPDYRGSVGFVSEIQSPDVCSGKDAGSGYTYTQMFNHMMNGNPGLGIRGVQPTHVEIYVLRAGECGTANQRYGPEPPNWTDGNTGGSYDAVQLDPVFNTTCPSSYIPFGSCNTTP